MLGVLPEPWCPLGLQGDHANLPQAHLELLWHPGSSFWGAQDWTSYPRCVLMQLKAFSWVIISAYSSPGLSLALGRASRFFFFSLISKFVEVKCSETVMVQWSHEHILTSSITQQWFLPRAGGQGGPEPELQPVFPVSPRASEHIWWTQCTALGWWGPGHFPHFSQSSTAKWGI